MKLNENPLLLLNVSLASFLGNVIVHTVQADNFSDLADEEWNQCWRQLLTGGDNLCSGKLTGTGIPFCRIVCLALMLFNSQPTWSMAKHVKGKWWLFNLFALLCWLISCTIPLHFILANIEVLKVPNSNTFFFGPPPNKIICCFWSSLIDLF